MLPLWYSWILILMTITAPSSDFHFFMFSFFKKIICLLLFLCVMSVSSSENQRVTLASAFPSTFMRAPGQIIGPQVHRATASPADCQLSRFYCHSTQYLFHRLTSPCSFYFVSMILRFFLKSSHISCRWQNIFLSAPALIYYLNKLCLHP